MSNAGHAVRVLITGFGPFPGIPQNASETLVLGVASQCEMPGVQVSAAIIPVVWAEARAAARRAAEAVQPHAILHFGVSKRAFGFEIETRAFNISGRKLDCAGAGRTPVSLMHAGKLILSATLPPLDLLRALRNGGYPAELSRDAGRYLCNALFYWSLADGAADGPLVSFIHIPAVGIETAVKSRLTMEDATAGARILVRASAEAVLRAKVAGESQRGRSDSHGSQALHRYGGSGRRAARGYAG